MCAFAGLLNKNVELKWFWIQLGDVQLAAAIDSQ